VSHTGPTNYPTGLTDKQGQILSKLLPKPCHRGAPRKVSRRYVINAIFYVLRSGCAWRLLPHEFPKWKTVYGIFLKWRNEGTWQKIHDTLRNQLRRQEGRCGTAQALDRGTNLRLDRPLSSAQQGLRA